MPRLEVRVFQASGCWAVECTPMADRVTAPMFRSMKTDGRRIVVVTAYDACTASLAEAAGVDAILVGDSVGNVALGMPTTLQMSLEAMVHHTAAAARGATRCLIIADMPFGSYQASDAHAVESAVALIKAGAEAVKVEGAYDDRVRAILRAGIPVMGHLGLTPQSIHAFGGHKVQGKGESADAIRRAAKALDDAGVFGMVLELVPGQLALEITQQVSCPTIGIGAGKGCDGQVQVFHDVVGLTRRIYKHAHAYCQGWEVFQGALEEYASSVRTGDFPGPENTF